MASITYTIADEKYDEFREAFLECHNVPVDRETGEPTMNDAQWIKEWGRRMFLDAYRQGRKRVRDKANPVVMDPDIVT